jgi:hypothetical protein
MKRASFSERSAGEAFRDAFPDIPINTEPESTHNFRLSRDQAQAALDELEPYFQAIDRLYSGDEDAAQQGTENEVWGFFDPLTATLDLRDQTAIEPSLHQNSVDRVLHIVKSLGLYAHRVIVQDFLLEALREYANPPMLRMRSDQWLLSGISFQIAMYSALLPYLDEEVVLPFSPKTTPLSIVNKRVFPNLEDAQTLVQKIERYIGDTHPREELITDSKSWPGGPIHTGTQGGQLLSEQRDIRILIHNQLYYCLESSDLYPRLTVAWTAPKLARLHRYVLEFINTGATRKEMDRPFILTELSTNGAIRPDLVSANDALAIRNSESVFLEWRDLIENCIIEMRDRYEKGQYRETLLRKIVKERQREWQATFDSVAAKSNFLQRVINPQTSFLTSFCVGAGSAALVASNPLVAGGAAAAKDVIDLIAAILFSGRSRTSKVALRSHFMALGARTDLSRR